jgi:hypothetical protein
MMNRSSLAAGAAMCAVLVASGLAQANTPARHGRASTTTADTQALKTEVGALKAQIQALTARLDAEAQAQQQTQARAQAAQSQAQAAQATAQAAQTQVEADASTILSIPAQVDSATKKATPKLGWWGDTKVGGVMFSDVGYIDNRNSAGKTAQSGVNYDIKRMYLTVEHKFNDTYSFNLTTDFTFDSNATSPSGASSPTPNEAGGANTASGIRSTQLFIKKAYLQAHYSEALNVRIGSAELPWAPFVESLNGYRYVEQMLIDRTRFGTTTDWGVHLYGNLFDHILGYQVSVIDGEGFKQPSTGTANRTNAVDVEGRINVTYKHFTVAVGGYDGKLGGDVTGVATYHDAQRFNALAAYADSKARIGVEYLWARYWKDVLQANPVKTNVSEGYSAFASWNFTPRVAIFGRYDRVKPQADTVPSEHEDFYDIGVAYKPIPALDFALVYKRDSVLNGSLSTADGVIGIPKGVLTGEGIYDEVGLFTQVKF